MPLTNKYNLPKAFVDVVNKEYQYQDKRYSVTTVIKGTKEILLQRRHQKEIVEDVSDKVFLIFGTAVHKVLEEGKEGTDELKETKISIEMPNGYTLSGQQDLYSESLKRITDYKTGTVWKVMFNDWSDYKQQLLIYAYMFKKIGFEVDNAEIVMMLKDWSPTKAKIDKKYPQHPVHIEHFDFSNEEFDEIEKQLILKFDEIERCEKLNDNEIPICNEEQRWSTQTKYAVMKKGLKKAIKLHDAKDEAQKHCEELGTGYYVEERKGEDKKCVGYCSCCNFCNYYKENYENNTPKQ